MIPDTGKGNRALRKIVVEFALTSHNRTDTVEQVVLYTREPRVADPFHERFLFFSGAKSSYDQGAIAETDQFIVSRGRTEREAPDLILEPAHGKEDHWLELVIVL